MIQIKYKDSPELTDAAYKQLYDNVFFILTKQDSRMFFIGFTVCGATLRAYLFHRGGTLEPRPILLHKEPGLAAQGLVTVLCSDLQYIGYDTTITTPKYFHDVCMSRLQAVGPDPWGRKMVVWFSEGGRKVKKLVTIDTCLFSSHSVQGRGTRVFACLHPLYEQFLITHREEQKQKKIPRVMERAKAK